MTNKQYTHIISYLSLIAKGVGYILISMNTHSAELALKKYEIDVEEMKKTWT